MTRWHGLFLVMAMLCEQAARLEHEYDFTVHQSGDACATRLHATPLSHGVVGAMSFVPSLPLMPRSASARRDLPQLRSGRIAPAARPVLRSPADPSLT